MAAKMGLLGVSAQRQTVLLSLLRRRTSAGPVAVDVGRRFMSTPAKKPAARFVSDVVLNKYKHIEPDFGFNGLGYLVYRRTYSRIKPAPDSTTAVAAEADTLAGGTDASPPPTQQQQQEQQQQQQQQQQLQQQQAEPENEEWWETVARVVEGTFSMQKRWYDERKLGFNMKVARRRAERMYERMFDMKFLPPGRGLWAMGTEMTEGENKLHAALNNCGFVSTEHMFEEEPHAKSMPFTFLMDASMLGVGVGFDVKGAEGGVTTRMGVQRKKPILVQGARAGGTRVSKIFVIPDSREGWVESVELLLDAYFDGRTDPTFDYRLIRKAGEPIKRFGGKSSGPEPLMILHAGIRRVLGALRGQHLTQTAIVDLMNLIGKCVVAGNVRRTAEIAIGPASSSEFMDLKNYGKNPHRVTYGWTSNNSIFCDPGMDFGPACDRLRGNGEPGFVWLHNMQRYGRMGDPPNDKDHRARGGNPCLEQTLESFELCCLVETFPHRHDSLADYLETLECAYLYAKTVTLGETHWPHVNRVMLRNRRIGCSMSGIAQFISSRGINELKEWCDTGYGAIQKMDEQFSDEFAVPRSIKTTSIKPSGTVSLLAGATAGMHYPISRYAMRRIAVPKNSDLLPPLIEAGYKVEPSMWDKLSMQVIFPVDHGPVRAAEEVSMFEQLNLAEFLQQYWADNQVSCTVTFDPDVEGPQIQHALEYYQYKLKGISFLPNSKPYGQMPWEAIDERTYRELSADIKPVNFSPVKATSPTPELYCDNEGCDLSLGTTSM